MDAIVRQQGTDAFAQEIGVFEENKQSQVKKQGEGNQHLTQGALPHTAYSLGYEIVGSGDECQEPKEKPAALIVEIIGENFNYINLKDIYHILQLLLQSYHIQFQIFFLLLQFHNYTFHEHI